MSRAADPHNGQAARRSPLHEVLTRVHLRLILFAVVLAAASLVLSGGMVIRSYAQRNLNLVARTVAYTVEPAVVFGDPQAIGEGIASVAGTSEVASVEVVDPSGRVLARWSNPRQGLPAWLRDAASRILWPEAVRAPVVLSGSNRGEVRISGNPEGLLRFALAGTIIALTSLALTVIAARILARHLQRDVVRPLSRVADVAHTVRTERTFDRRVPPSEIIEIDRLGQDFNALLAELQGWHASMTQERAELAHLAQTDPLTGLGNRIAFEAALAGAVTAAIQGGQSFAVLYCDADRFKLINDDFGHAAGDAVLVSIAERMRTVLRQGDQAFRLGGDEFAVLLTPAGQGEPAERVSSRLAQAMAEPVELPGGEQVVAGISIGVATYPDDGLSPQALLHRADRAMYQEKRARGGLRGGGLIDA